MNKSLVKDNCDFMCARCTRPSHAATFTCSIYLYQHICTAFTPSHSLARCTYAAAFMHLHLVCRSNTGCTATFFAALTLQLWCSSSHAAALIPHVTRRYISIASFTLQLSCCSNFTVAFSLRENAKIFGAVTIRLQKS